MRSEKIVGLQEDVKNLKDQVSYTERQTDQATQSMNYKLCNQLIEELSDVKRQLRKVEKQLDERADSKISSSTSRSRKSI